MVAIWLVSARWFRHGTSLLKVGFANVRAVKQQAASIGFGKMVLESSIDAKACYIQVGSQPFRYGFVSHCWA